MSERPLTSRPARDELPWSRIGEISYDPVFKDMGRFRDDVIPGTITKRPLLGTDAAAFEAALGSHKVGLMIGQPVHLETGKPFLLSSVKAAFRSVLSALEDGRDDTGYREPAGDPAFRAALTEYVLGATGPGTDLPPVACIQTVGGTNAVRRALEFVRAKVPGFTNMLHAPADRWVGHNGIAKALGVAIVDYPVMDPTTAALDGARMLSTLRAIPDQSLVCLSFENPAGLIPPGELIDSLKELALQKGFIVLFDVAYHSLMVGPREDTAMIRSFMQAGIPTLIAYSAGKAFTLTGARMGALFIAANNNRHLAEIQDFVGHELNRPDFTHASILGAHVVRHVLTNDELRKAHTNELAELRGALDERGSYFLGRLREHGLPESFALPTESRGLFRPLPWLGPNRVAALNLLGPYPLGSRITTMAPKAWLDYAARGIVKVCREVQEAPWPSSSAHNPLVGGILPTQHLPEDGC